ncbi:MAG TPA: nucleotidyltransferase domain-containing protein [Bacillales bacterium]
MADPQIERVKQKLIEELSPDVIYLFGSFATGNLRPNSDLDLAFLSVHLYDDYEIFILAQELADLANRDIDLIQLKKASTVFRSQIVGTGKVIYCRDENKKDEFEMLTYKQYMKLNEERKIILDQIQERGSVYGE